MKEDADARPTPASDDDFGVNALREVLNLISDTDITEITIERGGANC
jgi:hypothetical protein